MNKTIIALALLTGLVFSSPSFGTTAPQYRVIDLGLPAGWGGETLGVNNTGQAVGWGSSNGIEKAFLYEGGASSLLPTLGGYSTRAQDINNVGAVAGYGILTGDTYFHAFTYTGSVLKDLGTLGGNHSFAYGINDNGEVVGNAMLSSGMPHAFLYSNGSMKDLGTLSGGWGSWATDINNQSQVVGRSAVTGGYDHAFLYSNDAMVDIGTLGGTTSIANGINELGQVIGYSTLTPGSGVAHAFLYTSGVMKDLGTLGGLESIANGLNDHGVVVGYSYRDLPNTNRSSFIYDDANGMRDLNSLLDDSSSGYFISEAFSINNDGVIAATANGRAVLLQPVPEPETYAMMLAGLVLVGVAARRLRD